MKCLIIVSYKVIHRSFEGVSCSLSTEVVSLTRSELEELQKRFEAINEQSEEIKYKVILISEFD